MRSAGGARVARCVGEPHGDAPASRAGNRHGRRPARGRRRGSAARARAARRTDLVERAGDRRKLPRRIAPRRRERRAASLRRGRGQPYRRRWRAVLDGDLLRGHRRLIARGIRSDERERVRSVGKLRRRQRQRLCPRRRRTRLGEGEVARCRERIDRPAVCGQEDARYAASDIICRDGDAFGALMKPAGFTRPPQGAGRRAESWRRRIGERHRGAVHCRPHGISGCSRHAFLLGRRLTHNAQREFVSRQTRDYRWFASLSRRAANRARLAVLDRIQARC